MTELYQHADACFLYLDSLTPLPGNVQAVGDSLQQCLSLAAAIHAQPWLLGGFPYPLFKSLLECAAFHGVFLLLTKLFTLGL
jgi:hypothetical protein